MQNKLNILQIGIFSQADAIFLRSFKIYVAAGDSNVVTGPDRYSLPLFVLIMGFFIFLILELIRGIATQAVTRGRIF
jgi:hypothetical protein